jgi:hypothetical protein
MKKLVFCLLSLIALSSCKEDDSSISDAQITFITPSQKELLEESHKIGDSLKFDFEVSSKSSLVLVSCKFIIIDPTKINVGEHMIYVNSANFYELKSNILSVKWRIPNDELISNKYAKEQDTSTIKDELHIEVITEDHKKEFVYQFTNIN